MLYEKQVKPGAFFSFPFFVVFTACGNGWVEKDVGGDGAEEGIDQYIDRHVDEVPDESGDDIGGGDLDAGGDVPTHECTAGQQFCTDYVTRRACVETGGGRRWRDETCGVGQGCLRGECVDGECSDECKLGETNGERTCELFNIRSASWEDTDPASFLHDRAREYTTWLWQRSLYHGGVITVRFSDPPLYSEIESIRGTGDSAIWTGTYLAAEALRLMSTGSADARANVIKLADTLHLWFNVSGDPGLLARFAAPAGEHPLLVMDCEQRRNHCNVTYEGAFYDYDGHVSRDQYQGVLMGYALAYEALSDHDEVTKAAIREDVLELVQELIAEQSVPLLLTLDGTDMPVTNVHIRFVVLATSEMTDGAIHLIVDTSDLNNSEMWGFQEFMPNWGDTISQIPGFGWLDNVPRPDSAMMLSSFFRVALLVTDGVAGYEAEHAAIRDYYMNNSGPGGNINDWIETAGGWTYNDD